MTEEMKQEVKRLLVATAALSMLEVAREELTRAAEKWPDKTCELVSAFSSIPSPVISTSEYIETDLKLTLFRLHAKQLLRNVALGVSLDRPTLVELSFIVAVPREIEPIDDIALLVARDEETMGAYGKEPWPSDGRDLEPLWRSLEGFHSCMYVMALDKSREVEYERNLAEHMATHKEDEDATDGMAGNGQDPHREV